MSRSYWVYIASSRSRVLYIGITNDPQRRWKQHVDGTGSRFCAKHNVHHLVYVEECGRAIDAITREKQLKGWRRLKKINLIEQQNPDWSDLAQELGWSVGANQQR